MAIFLLTPRNLEFPEWVLSAFTCPVQVEADDESLARHAAAEQLCPRHGLGFPHTALVNPWLRHDHVQATVVEYDENLPLIRAGHPNGRRGRPTRTRTYKLVPKHLDAPEWRLSTKQETLYVRARNPHHARALAAMRCDINAPSELFHPWWQSRLAEVVEIRHVPQDSLLIDIKTMPARFGLARAVEHADEEPPSPPPPPEPGSIPEAIRLPRQTGIPFTGPPSPRPTPKARAS